MEHETRLGVVMDEISIVKRASGHAERVAICESGRNSTYRELLATSAELAVRLLDGRDDLREDRVAFLVSPGADYVAAQWGIWRAGGVAVPLSLSATVKELEYTLGDCAASTVVVTQEWASKVQPLCERIGARVLHLGDSSAGSDAQLPEQLPEVTNDRRAMILYTSGTTSKPKGVVTTHRCIQAQIETLVDAWRWQAEDRIPLFLPLHHIHGIINVLSCALWSGAQVQAFPRFDLEAVLRHVAAGDYTVFMAVPTIYVKLIEALESLAESQREQVVQGFADMRLMVSGSAALPASVHEKWTELTGQKLLERYGMTEIGMALSNPYDGERRPGAVGQPLPGVEVRLQAETGEEVTEEGVAGEIRVRGPNVFQEYWKRPDATRDSFVDGWFCTGDMAVVERGYYRIMGRSSVDIIKSGGYKLSALEIEASLLDHPAIAQCAVVGVADATWGETVAVAVVLRAEQALDLAALRTWCEDRISAYKIPRRMVEVPELPRNAMGKVTKPDVVLLFPN